MATSITRPATSHAAALLDERIDDDERRALAGGDRAAWERHYRAIQPPLYGYCLRLTGSEQAAADLVQEAFARTMQRCRSAGAPDGLRAFLFTCARNLHLDAARAAGTRGGSAANVDDVADFARDDDAAIRDTDPDAGALVAEQRDDVRAALADLPDRQRQALALCDMEGCSYAQVAEALDLKENAVAQLVFRARGKLRLALRLRQVDETRLAQDCREHLEPISRMLDGQLKGEPLAALQEHLADCSDCARVREEFALVQKRYRAWAPTLPLALSSDDAFGAMLVRSDQLAAAVGPGLVARTFGSRRRRVGVALLAGLLVFALAGAVATLAARDDAPALRTVSAAGVERVDPDTDRDASGGDEDDDRDRSARGSSSDDAGAASDANDASDAPASQRDDEDEPPSRSGADDEPARPTGSSEPTGPTRPTRPGGGATTPTTDGADPDPDPVATPEPDPQVQPDPTPDPEPSPQPPPPGPANLVATGISYTGSAVVSITNSGEQASGSYVVRVRVGTSSYTASAGSLAAGASTSVTVSLGGCREGTFTISALVDSTGVVAESSESDNTASTTVSNIC